MGNTVKITFATSPAFKAWLQKEAMQTGVSVSELIRRRCQGELDGDELLFSVLAEDIRKATTKATAKLDRGIKSIQDILAEIHMTPQKNKFPHLKKAFLKTTKEMKGSGTIDENFYKNISARISGIEMVKKRCIEVFGDPKIATEWLESEVKALGGKTPWEVMETAEGIELVLVELGRIEHGIVS